ncbi:MAG TPA: hypothetical protein VFO07_19765, partial [Roseiflexaceae bacterium]|nr:hypothetical protein [Roseiflexaceae bacterium]
MQPPAQLQSNSIAELLDATFRLYRAQFRALLTGLISVLGAMMLIQLMFRSGNHESIDWMQLSPLRPESLLTALGMLRFGVDPLDVALEYSDDLLLLLCAQTLLTGVVITPIARGYLAPFHMEPPPRPRGLRGEIKLVPGVLAALPLSVLGVVLTQPVSRVVLLWLDTEELLDPALLPYLWFNFGGPLLVCLALVALCARLLFAPQVAVLEGIGGRASLGRSWQLTRGAFGRVLVAALVVTLLPALLISSLELIPFLVFFLTEALDLYVPLLMITTVLGQVLLAFAYAFQIAFFTLLYYDLRFRGEGYDLVMQAHRSSAEQAKTLLESGVARLQRDDLSGARADFEHARTLLPDDRTILGYC